MGSPTELNDNRLKAPELAVILAAGEGSRLSPLRRGRPKPALPLLGMSLGERSVVACMDAGIEKFLVVLGHREDEVRAHFNEVASRRRCEVDFVSAENWELGNGASALAAAAKVADAPFVLVMSDHLISPSMVRAVLQIRLKPGEISLAVDGAKQAIFDLEDVTKVKLEQGRITHLGKVLDPHPIPDISLIEHVIRSAMQACADEFISLNPRTGEATQCFPRNSIT